MLNLMIRILRFVDSAIVLSMSAVSLLAFGLITVIAVQVSILAFLFCLFVDGTVFLCIYSAIYFRIKTLRPERQFKKPPRVRLRYDKDEKKFWFDYDTDPWHW